MKTPEHINGPIEIAILGGAFDPITKGHIDVTNFVLKYCRGLHQVWIMPCFQHMYQKHMADAKHRLAMCELAKGGDSIQVSPYEVDRQITGSTYDTVCSLIKEFGERHRFSIIIGMDNANNFKYWDRSQELRDLVRFIVVPRARIRPDSSVDWYQRGPHLDLSRYGEYGEILDTSSTMVRCWLRSKDWTSLEKHLDPRVLDYIRENYLYESF